MDGKETEGWISWNREVSKITRMRGEAEGRRKRIKMSNVQEADNLN